MTGERKFEILIAATILSARKLAELEDSDAECMPVAMLVAACAMFFDGAIGVARALAVGGLAMGLFFAAPFLPIYTPARARVYRLLKWAALIGVFCFVLGHDGLKYFWLLASCVWIPLCTEWTRFSIRRKMPVGEWPKQLYL